MVEGSGRPSTSNKLSHTYQKCTVFGPTGLDQNCAAHDFVAASAAGASVLWNLRPARVAEREKAFCVCAKKGVRVWNIGRAERKRVLVVDIVGDVEITNLRVLTEGSRDRVFSAHRVESQWNRRDVVRMISGPRLQNC